MRRMARDRPGEHINQNIRVERALNTITLVGESRRNPQRDGK